MLLNCLEKQGFNQCLLIKTVTIAIIVMLTEAREYRSTKYHIMKS